MTIKSPSDFGRALKRGAYAWPGGYPTFFVNNCGEALCFRCAELEARTLIEGIREGKLLDQDVNWEDATLYCDACGDRIESAYAEDEAKALLAGKRNV